jgi:hypothetical protein
MDGLLEDLEAKEKQDQSSAGDRSSRQIVAFIG